VAPSPPSDVLHTSKDDADAALSRYQEFVRLARTRDSKKADTDTAQSRYQEFVRRATTPDSKQKRQSVDQSVTDHCDYYVNVVSPGLVGLFLGLVELWPC